MHTHTVSARARVAPRHAAARRAAVLLLVAVSSTACAGGDAVTAPAGGGPVVGTPGTGTPGTGTPGPGSPGTGDPASGDLLGDWHAGAFGGTNYYDPTNGSYSAPSGAGNAWTFTPDGHFVNAQLVQTSFMNCTTRVFWYDRGTYTAGGGRLTLRSAGMYMKSEDTCNAQYNYERNVAGHNETLAYAVDTTGATAILAIHWPDQTLTFRH